jgi:hypothetical protein
MRRVVQYALTVLLLSAGTPHSSATEDPATAAEAMNWCCAQLFGQWRGKAWQTRADGRRIDYDASIKVDLSADGEFATFIIDYSPLNAGQGQPVRKVAFLSYSTIGPQNPPYPDAHYTLRYLWGGPFWGVRDFLSPPFGPITWTEQDSAGGTIRYIMATTGSEWSLAGFCCSDDDASRLYLYTLVTRVGPLGPRSPWFWTDDTFVPAPTPD